MEEYNSNSGNENERMNTTNVYQVLLNIDKWMNEIEQNNLDNLDNYISNTFALLRDKRLYDNDAFEEKYGFSSHEMNDLIPKIKNTIEIIKNNNYLRQIKDRTNIAKFLALFKGLSNGTFRGGVRYKKRTLKRGRHGSRRSRRGRHSKKRKTRHSKKKV